MAKRMRSEQRGNNSTTNPPRLRAPSYLSYRPLRPIDLSVFEDRRKFYPSTVRGLGGRPALSFSRKAFADKVLDKPSKPFRYPDVFRFRVPNMVVLCVRRKIRREVIHALDLTRKGAGGSKRRNEWSNVKC